MQTKPRKQSTSKSRSPRRSKLQPLKPFDKYWYYEQSVQSPEAEVTFLKESARQLTGKNPLSFREDFCGTGVLMCAWTAAQRDHQAYGIDLDPEPLAYGRQFHWSKLSKGQQDRATYFQGNVLQPFPKKVDLIAALNFSFMLLKDRRHLKSYFRRVYQGLKPRGVFFCDLLGGPESQVLLAEDTRIRDWTYRWECQKFDPIHHDVRYAIHFKRPHEPYRRNVFVYDWRLWTIPEIREIMAEVGFKRSVVFWEGDSPDGTGNGVFTPTESTENCDAWVVYIAGVK